MKSQPTAFAGIRRARNTPTIGKAKKDSAQSLSRRPVTSFEPRSNQSAMPQATMATISSTQGRIATNLALIVTPSPTPRQTRAAWSRQPLQPSRPPLPRCRPGRGEIPANSSTTSWALYRERLNRRSTHACTRFRTGLNIAAAARVEAAIDEIIGGIEQRARGCDHAEEHRRQHTHDQEVAHGPRDRDGRSRRGR